MRKFNFKIFKAVKTKKVLTVYHEVGHCAVAALHTDLLVLKNLSANKKYMKNIDPNYTGGLNIEWHTAPLQHEYDKLDKAVSIALAGMCAKTIFAEGRKKISENMDFYIQNPNRNMRIDGAYDDYEMAKHFIAPIMQNFQIKLSHIIATSLKFTFEFLLKEEVWDSVEKIAQTLYSHSGQTFTQDEISEQIEKSGLGEFIKNNKTQVLSVRYPITRTSLIYQ